MPLRKQATTAPCERYCGDQATGDFVVLQYIEYFGGNHCDCERLKENTMDNFILEVARFHRDKRGVHLGEGASTPRLQAGFTGGSSFLEIGG